jgi:hypothetical protein
VNGQVLKTIIEAFNCRGGSGDNDFFPVNNLVATYPTTNLYAVATGNKILINSFNKPEFPIAYGNFLTFAISSSTGWTYAPFNILVDKIGLTPVTAPEGPALQLPYPGMWEFGWCFPPRQTSAGVNMSMGFGFSNNGGSSYSRDWLIYYNGLSRITAASYITSNGVFRFSHNNPIISFEYIIDGVSAAFDTTNNSGYWYIKYLGEF